MNQNKFKVLCGILVVVLIAVIVHFKSSTMSDKGYSVVYLNNGEVYVGKLSTFPQFTLTDVYLFQATKDPTDPSKNSFQLNPLNQAIWAPEKLIVTRQNVLFYGPLEKTSKITQTIMGQNK